MTSTQLAKLKETAMWETWQKKITPQVKADQFAKSPIYIEQDSPSVLEFEEVVEYLFRKDWNSPAEGMLRDAQYGARVVDTKIGRLTRMWLDAQVEMEFLTRHLTRSWLKQSSIIDIGAGYGRLAIEMQTRCRDYICTDAVPISLEVCERYTSKHMRANTNIQVWSPDQLLENMDWIKEHVGIAINIHSWNECSLDQIQNWLDVLTEINNEHLFTVSHGQNESLKRSHPGRWKQRSYYSWGDGGPSYLPLLKRDYECVAEENIGLGMHPHALWRRKNLKKHVIDVAAHQPMEAHA